VTPRPSRRPPARSPRLPLSDPRQEPPMAVAHVSPATATSSTPPPLSGATSLAIWTCTTPHASETHSRRRP
jgi:hypothetical protein